MRRSYWRHTAPLDAIILAIVALLVWLVASVCSAQVTGTFAGTGSLGNVLDATRYCVPNDDLDDTAGLIDCLEAVQSGEQLTVYFPPGDYNFSGELPINSHTDPTIFDNVSIIGAPRAMSGQHLEEATGGATTEDDRRRTRFLVDCNDGEVWWDQQRAYRFGPILFADIDIQFTDRGSCFQFGDPAEDTDSTVTMRGLTFVRMYLSRVNHYGASSAGADVGIGDDRTWLIDATTDGYILNDTNESFGLRMNFVYDAEIDVTARGWKWGVWNHHCDAPSGAIHGMNNGLTLLETQLSTNAPVASNWRRVFSEQHLLGGAVVLGHVHDLRSETNAGNFPVPPGNYDMPTTAKWTVTAGQDVVTFNEWGGAYDALDYFEPYCVYRFTPQTTQTSNTTNTAEPPLEMLCTAVSANTVTFAGGAHKNYVARTIVGNGGAVERLFGVPAVTYGERSELVSVNTGVNDSLDLPYLAVAVGVTPTRIAGNSNGRGDDADNPQETLIMARCGGVIEKMHGGVDLIGSAGWSAHPLVNAGGIGPRFERRFREPIWDAATRKQIYTPGRGATSISSCAAEGTYHWLTEEDGRSVPAIRLSDCTTNGGWRLPSLRRSDVETDITVRCYASTGTPTLTAEGGGTGSQTSVLATGWNTVTLTLTAANMAPDGNGDFVRLSGSNIYFTEAVVCQD